MIDTSILLVGLLLVTNMMLMTTTMPYLPKKRKDEIVLDIAYSLVWEAERLWGGKTGRIKRAFVKAKLYVTVSTMPTFRSTIISGDEVERMIDIAVGLMHKYVEEENTRIK